MDLKHYRLSLGMAMIAGLLSGKAQALDLLEAYRLAQVNDAQYLTALSNYEAVKLNLPLARTANRPNVNADISTQYNDESFDPDEGVNRSADYQQGQLGVDLSQNLYDRSINYDIESATYDAEIAELQLGIARENLIARTVNTYLTVLAALDNENLAQLNRTAIAQQLDLATQRLEVGLGTRTDQYDAQARYESANAELIAGQNEVINAQQALEALIGQPFSGTAREEVRPLDNDKVTLQLVEGDQWVNDVLPRNRAYQVKLKQVDLSRVEVDRSKDARWPSFGLFAGAQVSDSEDSLLSTGGRRDGWQVGVRGSMPVYLGGSIKLRQEQSGHSFNAASYDAEQSRRDTDRTIRAARRGVQSLQQQLEARRESVLAGRSALESKEEGFKAGVTTNIDVLNAQRDLFIQARNYLLTSYDLINAIVELERSAGQLDEQDVEQINGWLK